MTASAADLLILRWIARCDHASAPAIGTACGMAPAEVRSRLANLESQRLLTSRSDKHAVPPRRVYHVTIEGRRAAGLLDIVESADR